MGSLNLYPVLEPEPAKEQMPKPQAEEKREISRLYNSIYYFIQYAYIVKFNESYRLIAYHQGHILCDQVYANLRDAKIAFSKLFHRKAWAENVKPQWTYFYIPGPEWMEKITPGTPPTQSLRGET